MSALAAAVAEYLTVRRAMGHTLERGEVLLGQFVAHLDAVGATTITVDEAVAWATAPVGASRAWMGIRLGTVRSFAAWLQARDPSTEIPPQDALGPMGARRAVPYLYTDDEIAALIDTAGRMSRGLQRHTFPTLIGLMAVSGMRISEVIGLDDDDVCWEDRRLLVEGAKFGKSRYVAVHSSCLDALSDYAQRRDHSVGARRSPSLLVSNTGTKLVSTNVQRRFRGVARRAGLVARSERCRPRLHDFRHRFAVQTLTDWYAAGLDVGPRLPLLATHLGHTDPRSTYWYLTATPELLALAAGRLQQAAREER
ncbi:tyrosine-type recombinase/integrase [soil metagenome]